MFEALYGKPLDENLFDSWFEKGRSNPIGYHYLLVIWSAYDKVYQPAFVSDRAQIFQYQKEITSQEVLVAAYDLYSESRISLEE
jgi:hypothetical protein